MFTYTDYTHKNNKILIFRGKVGYMDHTTLFNSIKDQAKVKEKDFIGPLTPNVKLIDTPNMDQSQ